MCISEFINCVGQSTHLTHTHTRTLPHTHVHSPPPHSSQDILEYRKKQRPLRVRTLDGTVKTILVDDSQNVFDLTKAICARIGEH